MRQRHSLLMCLCLLLAPKPTAASTVGLSTCDQQYNCIKFSLSDMIPASRCRATNCEYRVCLTANYGVPGCDLSALDAMEHACGDTGNACAVPQTSGGWNKTFTQGTSLCQYVAGGADVLFVMKDSTMCNHPQNFYPFGDQTLSARCSAEGAQGVCRNQNGECVWRVQVPDCPEPTPSPSPRASASTSQAPSPPTARSPSTSPRPSAKPSSSPLPGVGDSGGHGNVRPSASGSQSTSSLPSPSPISPLRTPSPRPSRSPIGSPAPSRSPSTSRSAPPSPSPSITPSPLACVDMPDWRDAYGDDCQTYVEKQWCNETRGYGPGWTGGTHADRANDQGIDATMACCGCGSSTCVADVMLAVDRSGSIGENWPMVMQYLYDRVNKTRFGNLTLSAEYGNRIGLVLFSTTSEVQCPLTYDKQELLDCISTIQYTGGFTMMADAIQKAGDVLRNYSLPQRSRVVEVITDGQSTNPTKQTIAAAKRLKDEGVTMIAVGVGNDVNTDELKGIASDPKENHWANIGTFNALGYLAKIITAQCIPMVPNISNWTVSPSPEESASPTPSRRPSRSPSPSPAASLSPRPSSSISPSPRPSPSLSPSFSRSPRPSFSPASPSPDYCTLQKMQSPMKYSLYEMNSQVCDYNYVLSILPPYCAPSVKQCGMIQCEGPLTPQVLEVMRKC